MWNQITKIRIQQRLYTSDTLTIQHSREMSINYVCMHALSPTCCLQSGGDLLILKVLCFVLVKHQEDVLQRD